MIELIASPCDESNLQPKRNILGSSGEIVIPGSNYRYRFSTQGKSVLVGRVTVQKDKSSSELQVEVPEKDSWFLETMGGYHWRIFNLPENPMARKRRFVDEADFPTFS